MNTRPLLPAALVDSHLFPLVYLKVCTLQPQLAAPKHIAPGRPCPRHRHRSRFVIPPIYRIDHLRQIHKGKAIKRRSPRRWAGGGGGSARLFTASYDGSLSMLDPCAGRFERLISSDEAEFSSFDCSPDANVTILGDNDGYLHVFDVREGQASARGKPAEIHNKRVNTLHVSVLSRAIPPEHLPATQLVSLSLSVLLMLVQQGP